MSYSEEGDDILGTMPETTRACLEGLYLSVRRLCMHVQRMHDIGPDYMAKYPGMQADQTGLTDQELYRHIIRALGEVEFRHLQNRQTYMATLDTTRTLMRMVQALLPTIRTFLQMADPKALTELDYFIQMKSVYYRMPETPNDDTHVV